MEIIFPGTPWQDTAVQYTRAAGGIVAENANWSVLLGWSAILEDRSTADQFEAWAAWRVDDLSIEQSTRWVPGSSVVEFQWTFTNDGVDPISDILLVHAFDPDTDWLLTSSFDTLCNTADGYASSQGLYVPTTMAYGVCDRINQDVGHTNPWATVPTAVYVDFDGDPVDAAMHLRTFVAALDPLESVGATGFLLWGDAAVAREAWEVAFGATCCADPDVDLDGYDDLLCGGDDCAPTDPSRSPAAVETCDHVDEDCDGSEVGAVDGTLQFYDGDGDGDGAGPGELVCPWEPRWVATDTDCDDTDNGISSLSVELCNGVDDDCDGLVDEAGAMDIPWSTDADGDGFGSRVGSVLACLSPGAGFVPDDTDCNDGDAAILPGAIEVCDDVDQDCNGLRDDGIATFPIWLDGDADGYGDQAIPTFDCAVPVGWTAVGGDCSDIDAAIHPDRDESCNLIDDDCDLAVDEPPVVGGGGAYADWDLDGHGDPAAPIDACGPGPGVSLLADDCDDTNFSVYPGALETCDGEDEDCNGIVDDGFGIVDAFIDADGDGFGDAPIAACALGVGIVAVDGDCDDLDVNTYPGATEICDLADNDCNGIADDAGVVTAWTDADLDGFGDALLPVLMPVCEVGAGTSLDATDCDDSDASVFPGADETCDGVDNDCNLAVDDEAMDATTWYPDADGDGIGPDEGAVLACESPVGSVSSSGDCNDDDADLFPGNPERCDDADQDCDEEVDEDPIDPGFWYVDGDGDGYGAETSVVIACDAPVGTVAQGGDCEDGDPALNPGTDEHCDDVDEDCNVLVDDDPVDGATWYDDVDGDGFGDPASAGTACSQPAGTVADGTDCDDGDANAWPGAPGWSDDCEPLGGTGGSGATAGSGGSGGTGATGGGTGGTGATTGTGAGSGLQGEEADPSGCSCDGSSGGRSGAWMLLGALGWLGRRNRRGT